MRIMHVCLSNFYIDGVGYQENFLVRQHVHDGHDVLVVASTETYDQAQQITYTSPGRYRGQDGALVIRLPYCRWLPHQIARKLRIHPGFGKVLAQFRPEVVMFHGASGNEVVTAAKYVERVPHVLFYVDSHADYNNSARHFFSREFLHRRFYRNRLRRALPRVQKILCISHEAMDFLKGLYDVPREKLEFFPLGGFPLSKREWQRRRKSKRAQLGLSDTDIVLIQAGKQSQRKRLIETLEAIYESGNLRLRMVIAGSLGDDIREQAESLIKRDSRVRFLGWQSTDELSDLLCSADLYVQPGTQSATMQHALCCGCPVLIDDVPAHVFYQQAGAIVINHELSLRAAIARLENIDFDAKRHQARSFAKQVLDYSILSRRILHA